MRTQPPKIPRTPIDKQKKYSINTQKFELRITKEKKKRSKFGLEYVNKNRKRMKRRNVYMSTIETNDFVVNSLELSVAQYAE